MREHSQDQNPSHLRLVANRQLVIHGRGEVVHGEPKPRPLQHPDKSQACPGDWLIGCPLAGDDLQGVAGVQRDGVLLQDRKELRWQLSTEEDQRENTIQTSHLSLSSLAGASSSASHQDDSPVGELKVVTLLPEVLLTLR